MVSDVQCTFEIFLTDAKRGFWRECATLDVSGNETSASASTILEYLPEYVVGEALPLSLRHKVSYGPVESKHWPSFLFDLLPQGQGRRYLLGELGLPEGRLADWPLLCAGAFNPIGRIRIKEAVKYYQAHIARQDPTLASKGFTLEDIVGKEEDFIEHLQIHGMLASGTSGVQGVAPKFLITKGKDSLWYADGALPDHLAAEHYLVKLPRGKDSSDLKILRNEAKYMRVAQQVGLHVHELPLLQGNMLFIPRFDREIVGQAVYRHHQESAASLYGQVGFDARPTQYQILNALRAHTGDPIATTVEFLKRDVLNLALGNTDNHGRNTAVQVKWFDAQLTPLFDFAPMYLDKDGIPRASRWTNEEKIEQKNWTDVLNTIADILEIGKDEIAGIRQEMHKFSGSLETLEDVMSQAGVDQDIIVRRHHDIQDQTAQLKELGAARTHKLK